MENRRAEDESDKRYVPIALGVIIEIDFTMQDNRGDLTLIILKDFLPPAESVEIDDDVSIEQQEI